MLSHFGKRWANGLAVPVVAGLGLLSTTALPLVPRPAAAIQYSDGTIGFSYPLRLTDSYATRTLVADSRVTYYLTFSFPAEAAEPLDHIVVSLDEGRDPMFRYRLGDTEAFMATPTGRVPLSLGSVTQDADTKALTITFDPPVPPGNPLVLALRPVQNPRFAGVYLFGTTAYPVGDPVRSTFMGYARLSFYERDGGIWP